MADAHEKWALVEFLDENVIGAGTIGQRMTDMTSRQLISSSEPAWRRSVLAQLSEPKRSTQCWAKCAIHYVSGALPCSLLLFLLGLLPLLLLLLLLLVLLTASTTYR